MVKVISEDLFKYANKYNGFCKIVMGTETFKELQRETCPERLKPWTFDEYKNNGFNPMLVGCSIIEGDFEYGYYLVKESN